MIAAKAKAELEAAAEVEAAAAMEAETAAIRDEVARRRDARAWVVAAIDARPAGATPLALLGVLQAEVRPLLPAVLAHPPHRVPSLLEPLSTSLTLKPSPKHTKLPGH